MVSHKDKVIIHGLINQIFKDNLKMEKEMEMEYGKVNLAISILEHIKTILNMDKVNYIGDQVMFIKDNLFLIKDKDMDKCIGKTEVIIKECGIKEFNMGKVNCFFLQIKYIQESFKAMFL
jgi:hypothetical protein